jgi:hypothetical protein
MQELNLKELSKKEYPNLQADSNPKSSSFSKQSGRGAHITVQNDYSLSEQPYLASKCDKKA